MTDDLGGSGDRHLQPASADQMKHLDLSERIDGLRGMAWAYAVLFHTGYTASSASKRFSATPPGARDPSNSKLMYQYLRGDRAPKLGPRGRYGFDLVAEIDAHHSAHRATRWLGHPIWMIFDKETKEKELEPFLNEEALDPAISQYWMDDEIPAGLAEDPCTMRAFQSLSFDGFMFICALFRAANNAGLYARSGRPLHFALLEYLTPHAGRVEPIFGFVQAPFLQMIRDFYFRSAEK